LAGSGATLDGASIVTTTTGSRTLAASGANADLGAVESAASRARARSGAAVEINESEPDVVCSGSSYHAASGASVTFPTTPITPTSSDYCSPLLEMRASDYASKPVDLRRS
jgi:hypothetical protein